MFDKIDKDHSGFVTEKELEKWIYNVQQRFLKKNSEEQFERNDLNKDGFLDWEEFTQMTQEITSHYDAQGRFINLGLEKHNFGTHFLLIILTRKINH